jgi:hypothetical protein
MTPMLILTSMRSAHCRMSGVAFSERFKPEWSIGLSNEVEMLDNNDCVVFLRHVGIRNRLSLIWHSDKVKELPESDVMSWHRLIIVMIENAGHIAWMDLWMNSIRKCRGTYTSAISANAIAIFARRSYSSHCTNIFPVSRWVLSFTFRATLASRLSPTESALNPLRQFGHHFIIFVHFQWVWKKIFSALVSAASRWFRVGRFSSDGDRSNMWKVEGSQPSFLFTLKTPKGSAMDCFSCGPLVWIDIRGEISMRAGYKTRNPSHNSRFGESPITTLANWRVTDKFCGQIWAASQRPTWCGLIEIECPMSVDQLYSVSIKTLISLTVKDRSPVNTV